MMMAIARWSGCAVQREAYTVFTRAMPARPPAATDKRVRTSVPDLLIDVPAGYAGKGTFRGGGRFLAEVKTVQPGARYNGRDADDARAVDARARGLRQEYINKAREKDAQWFGGRQPPVTPMEDVINNHGFAGFAVGRVGEASREVEDFVKTMADIGTTHGPRTHVLGPVSLNAAKGVLTRRYMSRLAMARWKGLADLTIDKAIALWE